MKVRTKAQTAVLMQLLRLMSVRLLSVSGHVASRRPDEPLAGVWRPLTASSWLRWTVQVKLWVVRVSECV